MPGKLCQARVVVARGRDLVRCFVADEPGIAMAQARSDCWVCWYTKGLPDGRCLRTELFQVTSLPEIEGLLERYRAEHATTVLA